MGRSIGVLATGHLWAGIVEGVELGNVKMYPESRGAAGRSQKPFPPATSSRFCAARSASSLRKVPSRAWAPVSPA